MRDLVIPPTVTRRLEAYYTDHLEPWLKSYIAAPAPAGQTTLDWAAYLARATTALHDAVEAHLVRVSINRAPSTNLDLQNRIARRRGEALAGEKGATRPTVWVLKAAHDNGSWSVEAETQKELANEVVRHALDALWHRKTLEEEQWRQMRCLFPENEDGSWRFPPLPPGDSEAEALALLEQAAQLVHRTSRVAVLQQTAVGWYVEGVFDGDAPVRASVLLACTDRLNGLMAFQKKRTEKAWADFRAMAALIADAAPPN